MPYAIISFDAAGGDELRPGYRAAHLNHIDTHLQQVLASGGLCDDEDRPVGGLIVLDTEDRAVAKRFVEEDPFFKAGIYTDHKVVRWRKGFFDRQRFV